MQGEKVWYVGINGQQQGPMPTAQVLGGIDNGSVTEGSYVFAQGMAAWTPISAVSPFAEYLKRGQASMAPPPPPAGSALSADVIDYKIIGEEMQFVEVTLDPGEATVSEAGALFYMDSSIQMKTIFGDGSKKKKESLMDKALSAGKRVLTGESLAMTQFSNGHPTDRQVVSFAAPYPGQIIPLDLTEYGGKIICQKDAFLAAAKGIKLGIEFQKKIGVGLFGGEGFILQSLTGDGIGFVHAGGCVIARTLVAGETVKLDTGCVVAFEPSVSYNIEMIKGISNVFLGGEGLFMATLTGPGTIWMQSLPFSRMAGKIFSAAPQTGGRRVGEGSALDMVGGLSKILGD